MAAEIQDWKRRLKTLASVGAAVLAIGLGIALIGHGSAPGPAPLPLSSQEEEEITQFPKLCDAFLTHGISAEVFVSRFDGVLFGLAADTGEVLWHVRPGPGQLHTAPVPAVRRDLRRRQRRTVFLRETASSNTN